MKITETLMSSDETATSQLVFIEIRCKQKWCTLAIIIPFFQGYRDYNSLALKQFSLDAIILNRNQILQMFNVSTTEMWLTPIQG